MKRDVEAQLEEIAADLESGKLSVPGCLAYFAAIPLLLLATCLGSHWYGQVKSPAPTPPAAAPRDWRETPDAGMANAMMHEFVRERLRSPGTAKFASLFDKDTQVRYLGDQTYWVRSWVDAQNAFGATVRTEYVGEIHQVSKDRWALISLDVQQR